MKRSLSPDVEERLRSLASSSGVSIDIFLRRVIEEKSALNDTRRLSAADWSQQFEDWADSFPEAELISDQTLSRENLYPDRL